LTEKTAGNNLNYVHTQDTIYIVSICAYAAEIFDLKLLILKDLEFSFILATNMARLHFFEPFTG